MNVKSFAATVAGGIIICLWLLPKIDIWTFAACLLWGIFCAITLGEKK